MPHSAALVQKWLTTFDARLSSEDFVAGTQIAGDQTLQCPD
jgi:hypothetical protein